jgi:hypothetical protein
MDKVRKPNISVNYSFVDEWLVIVWLKTVYFVPTFYLENGCSRIDLLSGLRNLLVIKIHNVKLTGK